VDIVAKSLRAHGFDAAPLHGDLDQSLRMKTLEDFRKDRLKILVASDVAARGLDIPAVSHVFNYDVPHHADDYVHRIGRTGRAGRKGQTFMLVAPADARNYDKVLKLTKSAPEEVVLDIDWNAVEVEERSGRGGKPDRGGRDRERDRGRSRRPEKAPVEGSPATPAAPPSPIVSPITSSITGPTAEAKPRSARGRGRGVAAAPAEPPAPPVVVEAVVPAVEAVATPSRGETRRPDRRPAAPDRAPRERPAPDERDGRAVGFGTETPAFLLRPTPLKKAAEAE
jgi:superfamily II DNA/RNA helicase